MTFVERVLQLIEEKNITKNKLLMDLGLSKNSFVNWIDRGNIPNGDVIVKISQYFDVSVDYILGLSDERHRLVSFDELDNFIPSYKDEMIELSFGIAGSEGDPDLKNLREWLDEHNAQYEISVHKQKKTAPAEQSLTDKQGQVLSLAKNLSDEDMQKLIDYAELLTKAKNQ